MQRTYQFTASPRTSLAQDHVGTLARNGLRRSFSRGASIQQQGGTGNGFWLVEDGAVTVCRYDRDGGMTVYGVLGPGDLFGELAYFAGIERQVDAYAESDATLIWIDGALADRLLADDPGLARHLLASLANQLRIALNQVEAGRIASPRDRLVRLLAGLCERDGPVITATQQQLAELVGVSRVTIGHLLKDLREQGILAPGYGSLRVMDAQRLQDASRN